MRLRLALGVVAACLIVAPLMPHAQVEVSSEKERETDGSLPDARTLQDARIRGTARLEVASASRADGRLADFMREIDEAIVDLRRALPESANPLGLALSQHGKALYEEGLYLQALPQFEEAASYLADQPNSEQDYVDVVSLQAHLLNRIERNGEALNLIDKLVADVDRHNESGTRLWSVTRLDRVEILLNSDKLDEAIKQLSQVRTALGGNAEAHIAGPYLDRLAGINIKLEKYPEAAKFAEMAIHIYRTAMPDTPVQQLEPMRKRARASEGMFDSAFSDRAFSELIALSVQVYRPDHPEVARDLNAYGNFLDHSGRLAEAETLFRRAVVGLERAYGGTGQKFLYGLNNLADKIARNGRSAEAAQLLERGLKIIGDTPGEAETRTLLRINYAGVLNLLDREQEALEVVQLIRDELPALGRKGERYAIAADIVSVTSLAGLGRLSESWRAGAVALDRIHVRTNEDAANTLGILLQMSDVARRGGDAENAWAAASGAAKLITEYRIESGQRLRDLAERSVPLLWQFSQK